MTWPHNRAVLVALLTLAWPLGALAKPKGKTQVQLDVKPASAQLFVDGKPMGKAGTGRVIDVTPGLHVIKLVSKRDEHEERLKIAPNQKTTYAFEFDEAPPANPENGVEPSPVDDETHKNEPTKP